jgi:hypothetical protein
MLSWIIQISIISIIFIFLVHNLLSFFKSTLTVPKMKDLVNSPARKYQDIFDTITNTNMNSKINYNKYLPDDNFDSDTNINENTYTSIDLLPSDNTNENVNATGMKDELKMFLKKQLNTSVEPEGHGLGLDLASSFGSSF